MDRKVYAFQCLRNSCQPVGDRNRRPVSRGKQHQHVCCLLPQRDSKYVPCYPHPDKTHEDPVFRLTQTRSKQADQSLCSVQRSVESPPVAVMEAGESRTQLVDDACWWLQSGGVSWFPLSFTLIQILIARQVNLVILIILGPQTLTVEMWVRTTAAGDLGSFASLRGSPLVYPRPVLGDNSLVLPLSIRYADLGIQTTNNLKNNTLVVPMDRWAAVVWQNMG